MISAPRETVNNPYLSEWKVYCKHLNRFGWWQKIVVKILNVVLADQEEWKYFRFSFFFYRIASRVLSFQFLFFNFLIILSLVLPIHKTRVTGFFITHGDSILSKKHLSAPSHEQRPILNARWPLHSISSLCCTATEQSTWLANIAEPVGRRTPYENSDVARFSSVQYSFLWRVMNIFHQNFSTLPIKS